METVNIKRSSGSHAIFDIDCFILLSSPARKSHEVLPIPLERSFDTLRIPPEVSVSSSHILAVDSRLRFNFLHVREVFKNL